MEKLKALGSALLIAVGIVVLGVCIKSGLNSFSANQRVVTVKGLAEREVKADKVVWPLTFKELGNDLSQLYSQVNEKNQTVIKFLKQSGIKDDEISLNSEVSDMQADSYTNERVPYRYRILSTITVNTSKVDTVLQLMKQQDSLIEQGVALTNNYGTETEFNFTGLNNIKPEMIKDATQNARKAGEQFAADSESHLGKIKSATQGQFEIYDCDKTTPSVKRIRVVTTIVYMLED